MFNTKNNNRILPVAGILTTAALIAGYGSNSAHAAPLGGTAVCTEFSGSTFTVNNGDTRLYTNMSAVAGATPVFSISAVGGGINYTFTYTDNNDTSNNRTKTGSLSNAGSTTVSFTANAATSNATIDIANTGPGDMSITATSCSVVSVAGSGATTSSAVVGAVSRSQTTVVQQNIGARASVVTGSVGAGPTGGVGGASGGASAGGASGSTGGTGGSNSNNSDNPSFADDSSYRQSTMNQTSTGLRQLAMIGNFDSSLIAAQNAQQQALGLGPTDQGDIGGAAGTDGRTALSSSSPITVWGHGSYTSVDNDYVSGSTDSRYDGDVWGYNIGVDYRVAENLTTGVSLGYSDTELTTTFNNGTYDEAGWVFSPYAIYSPIAGLNLVVEAGYGMGDIDVTRSNGSISGKTDSDLWYGALSASYRYRPVDETPLSVSPSLAVLAARKTVDSYTESGGTAVGETRSNTRQVKPAVEMAYDVYQGSLTLSPFVEAGMTYDFTDEINDDATAFNLGGGLRLYDSETGLNGSLEGNYLIGRTDYTEYTLAGTITYGFALSDENGQDLGIVKPFFGSNLNEYGNQRLRGGLGYSFGDLSSELALSHMMSVANDNDQSDESAIEVSLSVPF